MPKFDACIESGKYREVIADAAVGRSEHLVEVTPTAIRLRKRALSTSDRKRSARDMKKERASV